MAGHFICANRCRFRRNTLISKDGVAIVISSVGLMEHPFEDEFEQIGCDRYFETMVFHASWDGRYWDADVERQISVESPWAINEIDADDKANDMHETVVTEVIQRLLNGEWG